MPPLAAAPAARCRSPAAARIPPASAPLPVNRSGASPLTATSSTLTHCTRRFSQRSALPGRPCPGGRSFSTAAFQLAARAASRAARFQRLQRARHARVKAVGQSAHCAPIALATEPPDARPGWLHPRIEPGRRQLALVRPAPPTVRRGCVVPGPLANILFVAQVWGKPNLQVRTDHGPAVCTRGPPIDNLRGALAPPAPRGISPSASPLLQIPAQTACLIPGLF